jgi:N-acetylgalactosamine-6-sulfatase
MELDDAVGKILLALKAAGIDNNTLVFFTSDNGAALVSRANGNKTLVIKVICENMFVEYSAAGCNGPLLCGKQTTFDGGFRVPTVARWPGQVAPGSISSSASTHMDIFATLVDLAGAETPTDRVMDGHSMKNILLSNCHTSCNVGEMEEEHPVFFYRGNLLYAVRQGLYKMHLWTWTTPVEELEKVLK